MNIVIASAFADKEKQLKHIISHFNQEGTMFVEGRRNTIKTFPLDNITLNVKAFRVPNALNKVVYRFFRKSKARRSYEFANILLEKGIGTPKPIAFFENQNAFTFKDSYYICEHLQADLTFRELVLEPEFPEHEEILRQFTRFSFLMHEKGVEFKDHSPGNTLIKKEAESKYSFYLVDLNRMNFHEMDFDQRMENLKRLTPKKEMVEVMANEYAKLYKQKTEAEIFETLWGKTEEFQRKFWRKRKMKAKLKLK